MNTLKEVPHPGAIDHAIEVLRASFDHPEADEAIAGLMLLREQTAWTHHQPALLTDADAAADLAGVARPGAEPYAYAVYFPDEARDELVHHLDDLLDDLTNCTHSITPLYTTPQSSQPEPALAAQPGAVGEIPTVCDGKEQEAFEKWAVHNRFNLSEHPLHYLFLDPKTDAARQAWKGALEYVGRVLAAAPTEAKPPQARQPLTDEQWNRVSRAALEAFFECSRGSVTSQIDCAAHAAMRATEKAHGIGAAQKGKP